MVIKVDLSAVLCPFCLSCTPPTGRTVCPNTDLISHWVSFNHIGITVQKLFMHIMTSTCTGAFVHFLIERTCTGTFVHFLIERTCTGTFVHFLIERTCTGTFVHFLIERTCTGTFVHFLIERTCTGTFVHFLIATDWSTFSKITLVTTCPLYNWPQSPLTSHESLTSESGRLIQTGSLVHVVHLQQCITWQSTTEH